MPRPPLRAVIAIAMGWVGLRAWLLWPGNEAEKVVAREVAQAVQALPPFLVEPAAAPPAPVARPARRRQIKLAAGTLSPKQPTSVAFTPLPGEAAVPSAPQQRASSGQPMTATSSPAPQMAAPAGSRWSGWAYVFVRPGGGRTLAAGGQLGGSQAAARVAYRLSDRLSFAARAYAPLGGKGAEAAVGADMAIGPVHAIVERRVGIDRQGREAWSAYATTGAYREIGPLVLDAYAQAGIVGARRRDGFVDGAMRAGMRPGVGGPIIGGGVWGAAQPGAARIDIGPRVAWTLPGIGMIANAEGRFRFAGKARPGSGVAFTLARNF